jgi:hypothetical protein
MLDWEFSSEKSLPFLAPTDASSLCAPLQQYICLHAGPSTRKNYRPSSCLTDQGGPSRRDGALCPRDCANDPLTSPTAFSALSSEKFPTAGVESTARSSTNPSPPTSDLPDHNIHKTMIFIITASPSYLLPITLISVLSSHSFCPVSHFQR